MPDEKRSQFLVRFEDDPDRRQTIADAILRSLPEWFGIESAIQEYVAVTFVKASGADRRPAGAMERR